MGGGGGDGATSIGGGGGEGETKDGGVDLASSCTSQLT